MHALLPNRWFLGLLLLFLASISLAGEPAKTRVLIVTGGHDFERPQFFQMFTDNPEITFQEVQHPNAHAYFKSEPAKDYDVILLYDMYQPISEQARQDFVARLKDGKGLVVMHHALASYQDWPDYERIIGGRYYLKPGTFNGKERRGSTFKHDVDLKVKVLDPSHPVTKGLQNFEIRDEGYNFFGVGDDVHKLLSTEHPESGPVIAWTREHEKARVVLIQGGHDHFAYENPHFRQLMKQAIRWVAKKP